MIVYWVTIALVTGLEAIALRFERRNPGERDARVIALHALSLIAFVVVTGLRYQVGQDYSAYETYYQTVGETANPGIMEWGFFAIVYLCNLVTPNPAAIFIVSSVLFYLCTLFAVRRLSPYGGFSFYLMFVMGYYFWLMNGMRQMMAMAVLLVAMCANVERKPIRFLVLVALAATLHASALVFLPLYLFGSKRLDVPVFVYVLIAIAAFIAVPYLAQLINAVVGLTSYSIYVGSSFDDAKSIGYVQIAMSLVVLCFALVAKLQGKDKRFAVPLWPFLWPQLASCAFTFMTGEVVLIQRMAILFGYPAIIMLPLAVQRFESHSMRVALSIAIVVLYAIYTFITVGMWNSNAVLPYQSLLFEGVLL